MLEESGPDWRAGPTVGRSKRKAVNHFVHLAGYTVLIPCELQHTPEENVCKGALCRADGTLLLWDSAAGAQCKDDMERGRRTGVV